MKPWLLWGCSGVVVLLIAPSIFAIGRIVVGIISFALFSTALQPQITDGVVPTAIVIDGTISFASTLVPPLIAGFTVSDQPVQTPVSEAIPIQQSEPPVAAGAETPQPPSSAGSTVNSVANLRAELGTNYDIVDGLATGDPLNIVARDDAGDRYQLDSGAWIARFLVDNAPAALPVAAAPASSTQSPVIFAQPP